MKKIFSLILGTAALFTSCENKLDIVPLGYTTLDTVDDLESLINLKWRIFSWDLDHALLCGQTYGSWAKFEEFAKNKNTLKYALIYGDPTVDRVNLNDHDARYSEIYSNINYLNIMLSKLPDAKGDSSKKERLMAEGKVLRAWLHFIAVNFYAQPYDATTAKDLGGIAYVDNTNSGEQKTKLSLQKTYDRILEDCSDENISKLSTKIVSDPSRFEVDFGYAVRAMALFQMKRYQEALEYANKAISANPFLEDRSAIVSTGDWDLKFESPDNYLFIDSTNVTNGSIMSGHSLTKELTDLFEEGDYVRYYTSTDPFNPCWLDYDLGETFGYGAPGTLMYSGSNSRINTFGINTEMMYYIAGESLIHLGQVEEGLNKVDQVRQKRIHPDFYKPFKGQTSDAKEAMDMLWNAKRIEFILHPVILYDIKRRNTEPEFRVIVKHHLYDDGEVTIPYDSPLWVFPFPMEATNYNSSLTQNY